MEKLGNTEVCEVWGPVDKGNLSGLLRDVPLRGNAGWVIVEVDMVCEDREVRGIGERS